MSIVADATFYGRKRHRLGTLVFKDAVTKEILIWKHIETERIEDYVHLMNELIDLGFTINGITVDGKRGLFKALDDYPVQMCLFHQRAIIHRYLTRKPKLQASKELKKIVQRLGTTTQVRFMNALNHWYRKHETFVNEKTLNEEMGQAQYTHKRLRSAYRSLANNMPYRFTYKNRPELQLSSTTNALDGAV